MPCFPFFLAFLKDGNMETEERCNVHTSVMTNSSIPSVGGVGELNADL